MKKILSVLLIAMTLFSTNTYAEAVNVKSETFKEDKEVLMSVLEKGQCGQICVRCERDINRRRSTASSYYAFGFCRVSVTICKD